MHTSRTYSYPTTSYVRPTPQRLTPKARKPGEPLVFLSPLAEARMSLIIASCRDEIGWLSFLQQIRVGDIDALLIQDAVLFEQRVSPVTTELDPASIGQVVHEMLRKNDDIARINRLRVWGHSHVYMSTGPSGQDDTQMRDFAASGVGRMVRLIGNKLGDLRVDVFDSSTGFEAKNIGWSVLGGSQIVGEAYAALETSVAAQVARCVHPMSWRPAGSATSYTQKPAAPAPITLSDLSDIASGFPVDTSAASPQTPTAPLPAAVLASMVDRDTSGMLVSEVDTSAEGMKESESDLEAARVARAYAQSVLTPTINPVPSQDTLEKPPETLRETLLHRAWRSFFGKRRTGASIH